MIAPDSRLTIYNQVEKLLGRVLTKDEHNSVKKVLMDIEAIPQFTEPNSYIFTCGTCHRKEIGKGYAFKKPRAARIIYEKRTIPEAKPVPTFDDPF